MKGILSITKIPPAKHEAWYSKSKACVACAARVMNRFERGGDALIRVLHEETCQAPGVGADRAPVSRGKPRSRRPHPEDQA